MQKLDFAAAMRGTIQQLAYSHAHFLAKRADRMNDNVRSKIENLFSPRRARRNALRHRLATTIGMDRSAERYWLIGDNANYRTPHFTQPRKLPQTTP